jgi:uncharacterized protein
MINRKLIGFLKDHYHLEWHGMHGVRHWARVRAHGLAIARESGADVSVVELFAFLHDSCRHHDGYDEMHGKRAARLAERLQGRFFRLPRHNLLLLIEACEGHTVERWHRDVTVATCWDADRLDLGRVGIQPDPNRLLTDAARRIAAQLDMPDHEENGLDSQDISEIPEFMKKYRD